MKNGDHPLNPIIELQHQFIELQHQLTELKYNVASVNNKLVKMERRDGVRIDDLERQQFMATLRHHSRVRMSHTHPQEQVCGEPPKVVVLQALLKKIDAAITKYYITPNAQMQWQGHLDGMRAIRDMCQEELDA